MLNLEDTHPPSHKKYKQILQRVALDLLVRYHGKYHYDLTICNDLDQSDEFYRVRFYFSTSAYFMNGNT